MRVLCVSNMYPGPRDPDYGAFVEDMCTALAARGLGVERAVIDHRAGGRLRTPAKYAALLGRTARRVRGCDVVYAHYLFPTGAVAAACARAARVPWVVTAHGQDVRNLDRPAVRRATQAALAGAAGVIAVSRYLADALRVSGLRLPRLHVADMGVDLGRFAPGDRTAARGRLSLPRDGPLILAVGGLTERKNPLGLLQAFARVRAIRPDARLALVGDGPLAGAVAAGVARLGLDGAVIRPGAVAHGAVADWMRAADLLAVVSRVEPLGQVALEALACGRPVVATRVGGTAEVVPVPSAGALVDPLDPGSVAAALLAVLRAPIRAETCRAAAAEHAVGRQAERVAAILTEAVRPG